MVISAPERHSDANRTIYTYEIDMDARKQDLWISLDNEYVSFFCKDRVDGILVMLLLVAMKNGEDIYSELPVSESLLFKVQKYLIPFLCKINPKLKPISVHCKTIEDIQTSRKIVATGISCGVDSLSTIACHSDKNNFPHESINCLTLFNTGYYGKTEGSHSHYKKYIPQSQEFCSKHSFPLLLIDSNVYEFMQFSFLAMNTYFTCGMALMLQNGIYKYLYASGYPAYSFEPNFEHVAFYDIFLLSCISTRGMEFVSGCSALTRVEKLALILDTLDYASSLYVCTSGDVTSNCSMCEKCVRTLLGADSMNKVENLAAKFNMDLFHKKRAHYIAFMLRKKRSNVFYQEIYDSYRRHKIKFPFLTVFYLLIPTQIDIKNFINKCAKIKRRLIKK